MPYDCEEAVSFADEAMEAIVTMPLSPPVITRSVVVMRVMKARCGAG